MKRAALAAFLLTGTLVEGCLATPMVWMEWRLRTPVDSLNAPVLRLRSENSSMGERIPAGSRIAVETVSGQVVTGYQMNGSPELVISVPGDPDIQRLSWSDIRCLAYIPHSRALRSSRFRSALVFGGLALGNVYMALAMGRSEYHNALERGMNSRDAFWTGVSMAIHPVYGFPFQAALIFSYLAWLTDRTLRNLQNRPSVLAVVSEKAEKDEVRVASERCV